MRQNELLIFDRFKLNTDAVETNRGFLYQYLKTLETWLINVIEGTNFTLYCETEDDMKEIDEDLLSVKFTQIKCYSSNLGTQDEEISKSLYNFFILYNLYKDYNGLFVFETNTSIKRNDKLLKAWVNNQDSMDLELFNQCISRVKELLESIINKKLDNSLSQLNNRIEKYRKRNDKEKITLLKKERFNIIYDTAHLLNILKDKSILESFTKKIRWSFENIKGSTAVENLKMKCMTLIYQYTKNNSYLLLTRLLSEIYFKSSSSEKEGRKLDKILLDRIINESEEEMFERTNGEILGSIHEISGKLDEMHQFLGKQFADLKERIPESPAMLETTYDLPYYDGKSIKEFINNESNNNQSRLEGKIKLMNLEEELESDLIQIATSFRCRYLIHLEQLQLNGLEEQYNTLKALEESVKQECFEAKLLIESKDNFNSALFWKEFKKKLELFAKDKKIDNPSVVHAQMYQMAAECPLRWSKVGS
ncbi:hypothetical protein [Bacillus andreraoultii]|uniref:hypothetical protein n=1 Tax=Bacillus andreraoultii TaxID=1499685 RepID=UPI00053A767E|nr:hypothetical protein [Bacillus andreraoultii]